MTTHMYAVRIHLVASGPDRAGLQDHVLDVSDHLVELEVHNAGLLDWSLGTTIIQDGCAASIEAEFTIDAPTWGQALDEATGLIRTAIHASGGATPGWDDDDCETGGVVYRIDDEDATAGGVHRLIPA